MKYSAVVLSLALGAFALPQEASSVTSAPSTTATPELSAQQSCAVNCDADDVTCRAACFGVARPNSSQAVDTNECAAKCDQGDGSPEDTEKYSECVQSCIYSLFPSSQTLGVGAPAQASSAAGNDASTTGTGAAATQTAESGSAGASSGATPTSTGSESSASGSGTATGSAAGSDNTGAASANSVHLAGYGLAGLLAVFAL